MEKASVFKTNRSQAIRLPKSVALPESVKRVDVVVLGRSRLIAPDQAAAMAHAGWDVISQGAAGSWQMANRSSTMLADKFDFGFAVDWMRKDLGICLDEAKANDMTLPVTALVDQFYGDVQKMGGGRWDTSSLIRRLTK